MKKKFLKVFILLIMIFPFSVLAQDVVKNENEMSVTLEKCIDGDTATFKDTSGNIITVAEYNNLTTTEKANYKIITHVNTATNDMLTQIEYDALADKTNISRIDDYPIYPYNGKTFKATVNVYANAEVVSSEE